MKTKLLLLSLALLLGINSKARQQYKRCLDDGVVKWSILAYQGSDSGIQSTEIAAYSDTLINGLIYKKLFVDEFNYLEAEESNTNWKNYTPDLSRQLEGFYIRESEDASKLFIFDDNENEEYLISDLNLQKGDEFLIHSQRHDGKFALVDSVYIKDDLKHVQLVLNLYSDPQFLTFIEGVGSDIWFIIHPQPWYFWNDDGIVNCFQNQSVFYKKEFPFWWGDCHCGYRDMNVAIRDIDSSNDYNISVKEGKIEILFSDNDNKQISIYNVNGILLDRSYFSSRQNITIPISSFSKGVYVLKIFNKDKKQIFVNKIIL